MNCYLVRELLKGISKRGTLVLFLLLFGATQALAQTHVDSLSGIRFVPGTMVYQKGNWKDLESFRRLNQDLQQLEHPIVLIIADKVSDESFVGPDGNRLRGYEAAKYAIGTHGLMSQADFKAMIDEETGLPDCSVLLISPERVAELDNNRPWDFGSSPFLDSLGLKSDRTWKDDVDDVGLAYLPKGQIDQAVLETAKAYDKKIQGVHASRAFWRGFWALFPWAVGLIVLLVASFWLYLLYMQAEKAREELKKTFEVWQRALAGKQELLDQINATKTRLLGASRSELKVEGKQDSELANDVIHKIGRARLLLKLAIVTFRKVEDRLRGFGNFPGFSASRYTELKKELDRNLEFDPEREDAKAFLDEDDKGYVWAPLSSYEPIRASVTGVIEKFNTLTKEASEKLGTFEAARSEIITAVSGMETELTTLAGTIQAVADIMSEPERPSLAALLKEVVPALRAEGQRLGQRAVKSPTEMRAKVQAFKGRLGEAQQSALALKDLVSRRADRKERCEALEATGLNMTWLRELGAAYLQALIAAIDSLDSDKPDLSGTARTQAMGLAAQLDRVESHNKTRQFEGAERARLAMRLATERERLSKAIKVPANQIFAESADDADKRTPDVALADAERELSKARAALGKGDLAGAEKLLELAVASNNDAEADIARWLRAYEEYGGRKKSVEQRRVSIDEALTTAQSQMGELGTFDPAVLEFKIGDPADPQSDGTMADNLEEIAMALSKRDQALEGAQSAYDRGAMLEAAKALSDAENWSQFAVNRIAEIAQMHRKVTETHADNGVRLPKFLTALKHELSTPFDNSTRQVTIDDLSQANEALKKAAARHKDRQPNPFEIARAIEAARVAMTAFGTAKARDLAEFNDARTSYDRAARQLDALSAQLDSMRGDRDSLPDAQAFMEANRQLPGLRSNLQRLQKRLAIAHADWFPLDDDIDALYEATTLLLNRLREEKYEGDEALKAITKARSKVREARDFSGDYGIAVTGLFGTSRLSEAERALGGGNFGEALRLADSAFSQAKDSIEDAEERIESERRRRRKAAEAAAAARRAAESASYRSSSSSYSSSSSSSSGYSFSSGVSSSSFSGGFSSGVSSGKGW